MKDRDPPHSGGRPAKSGPPPLKDRNTIVLELWDKGQSASQISLALRSHGHILTRNAVIGVVHRHGTPERGKPSVPRRTYPKALPKPVAQRANKTPVVAPKIVHDLEAEPPRAQDPVTGVRAGILPHWEAAGDQARPLEDLGNHDCRWPVGEGSPQLFCGKPCEHDKTSYCEHHGGKRRSKTQPQPLTKLAFR